ncbi:ladderlectin-like [Pungitius pungitius]|uniref:ladderlectin-like n=1 Tax=Pungitius pungitius TaxID=134920 RepID=UPI002E153D6B
MKTVAALLCAVMALTIAAALAEEQPGQEPTGELQLVKRSCHNRWTRCNGRWFRYIPTAMTWAHAERNCLALGGHLASVHNLREYRTIQIIIFKSSFHHHVTWIGGSDAKSEKKWVWSDGTCFDYTNWACGEPNNHCNQQHCLQMNFGGQKAWDDVQCWSKRPSVCAK